LLELLLSFTESGQGAISTSGDSVKFSQFRCQPGGNLFVIVLCFSQFLLKARIDIDACLGRRPTFSQSAAG
jgi:hypothetical protein